MGAGPEVTQTPARAIVDSSEPTIGEFVWTPRRLLAIAPRRSPTPCSYSSSASSLRPTRNRRENGSSKPTRSVCEPSDKRWCRLRSADVWHLAANPVRGRHRDVSTVDGVGWVRRRPAGVLSALARATTLSVQSRKRVLRVLRWCDTDSRTIGRVHAELCDKASGGPCPAHSIQYILAGGVPVEPGNKSYCLKGHLKINFLS